MTLYGTFLPLYHYLPLVSFTYGMGFWIAYSTQLKCDMIWQEATLKFISYLSLIIVVAYAMQFTLQQTFLIIEKLTSLAEILSAQFNGLLILNAENELIYCNS